MDATDTPAAPSPRALITVAELSELTGWSDDALYRRVRLHQLPGARRIGRSVILHRETIMAWLAGAAPEPPEARA